MDIRKEVINLTALDQTRFDPKLPRWAQNDAKVVALCAQSPSFRRDVYTATKAKVKRQLKREAARHEDRGDGKLEPIDVSL